jgi:hypothetical protein
VSLFSLENFKREKNGQGVRKRGWPTDEKLPSE